MAAGGADGAMVHQESLSIQLINERERSELLEGQLARERSQAEELWARNAKQDENFRLSVQKQNILHAENMELQVGARTRRGIARCLK